MNWDYVGLATVLVAAVAAYLAHKRSRKVDTATEISGVASNHRAGTTQVIEGYKGLLDAMRQGVADAEKRCKEQIADAVADLKEELTKRPTKTELLEANGILLDANGKLRKQLLDLGETPKNGPTGETPPIPEPKV